MKKVIFILGTGRSGTSALTGCINLLGAYLGEELTAGNNLNEKGYFESKKIVQLDKQILENNNIQWYFTEPEDIRAINIQSEIINSIEQIVLQVYGDKEIIAIKDPRLCLLIDNYKVAFTNLGYELYYLRTRRDETATAKSVVNGCNELEEEKTLRVVDKYNELLDGFLKNNSHQEVKYNDLIDDTEKVIISLKKYLPFLDYSPSNLLNMSQFLDPSLRHY